VVAGSWYGLDRLPFTHPEPTLSLSPGILHAYSALLGLAFGAALVVSSRVSVSRYNWARRLHDEFRPVARQLSASGIVLLALLSALGEELLFRGLLQPYVGVIAQALTFGLVHQVPGPSRWVWASWAAAVGLGLGLLFALTGSLLGPILAHAMVNGLNLYHLKHHDLHATETPLGGLLGRSGTHRHP
ncbi:MAG: hypothetical protein RJA70_2362, partial [Pseudomonadota bacterium]|jgi:membrane protease YdiL (CAAX protease family)